MDLLNYLYIGFQTCLQPANLFLAFIGCVIGTLVGVLPGLGPAAAISLLLPTSFHITPVGAMILLSGIYYGSMYGGSTTSILVNIPGEAASVVTCLDGYEMAKKGRAGPALGMAAIGSFIAGTVGVVGLMVLAPPLAEMALKFGPPEYTTLMVLGLVVVTFLVKGSMAKALLTAAFGLFLSTVGLDAVSGVARFSFNVTELMDGIGMVPVVMGLFGISEVLLNLEKTFAREILKGEIKNFLPTREDWRKSAFPIARGSLLGFFLGILPGGGAVLGSFVAYAIEKRISKYPEKFGTGVIEGVASPEAANNSATAGAYIPLLTLGIPSNVVMAILLGAMMIHGITPGPNLINEHPQVFWGVIISMYIGNAMLLVLNLPLVGLWVQVLRVPYGLLFPLILLFCLIGAYSLNFAAMDIIIMIVFGIVGYLMKKTDYEGAPLILALVLGNLFENALRQSLMLSDGSFGIFFTRPIAAVFLWASIILLVIPLLPWLKKRRPAVGIETQD
ncbi:MAG TPA: tripartite tricarboxylate transporter permease [Thermodesulfobacteriota bacterium]|nr:tripartite tricarboxylate transporter permease [Thermodesulfobacteriota bacterium]